jgi:hypothetical protein
MKRQREEKTNSSTTMNLTILELASNREASIRLPEGVDTVLALQEQVGAEFSIPTSQCGLTFAGDHIDATLPLSAQVPDGATLHLRRKRFHLSDVPPNVQPDQVRLSVYL